MTTKTKTTEQKVEKLIRDHLLYAGGILTLILYEQNEQEHNFTYSVKLPEITNSEFKNLYQSLVKEFGQIKYNYRILPCKQRINDLINIIFHITVWTGLPF